MDDGGREDDGGACLPYIWDATDKNGDALSGFGDIKGGKNNEEIRNLSPDADKLIIA